MKTDMEKSKNILLTIEYDGTNFKGWQSQEGQKTVQSVIEDALEKALSERVSINAAGRTDAGVHAYGQTANFVTGSRLPVENLKTVVNNFLSVGNKRTYPVGSVRIVDVKIVQEDFHARFSCVGKTYMYKILLAKEPDIFKRNYFYRINKELNFENMAKAAKRLVGEHDFASFQASGGTPRKTTVRNIFDIRFDGEGNELYLFVTGDGFLYNMVRIIAGTLVDVGIGKINPADIGEILTSCDRKKAGHTAPPCGLYLYKVYYSKEEMEIWTDPVGTNIL